MKRIVSLILVMVCLCYAAGALAAPRAGQKPSFGSQNIIKDADDALKDVPNAKVDNAKHGVVHGKVRIFGYKDEIRKPANRFSPYAVYPDVAHVEGQYLEYRYKKISSEERLWELCIIDEHGNLGKRFEKVLSYHRCRKMTLAGVERFCLDGEIYDTGDSKTVELEVLPGALWYSAI